MGCQWPSALWEIYSAQAVCSCVSVHVSRAGPDKRGQVLTDSALLTADLSTPPRSFHTMGSTRLPPQPESSSSELENLLESCSCWCSDSLLDRSRRRGTDNSYTEGGGRRGLHPSIFIFL
ncbi:hypothetical protein MHYP_G00302440 [Metynnis hypsauchen]